MYKDHLNDGFREKPPVASVLAQRWYTTPGIQRVNVTEKGLKATLYIPTGITERGLDMGLVMLLYLKCFIVKQQILHDFIFSSLGPGPFPAVLDLWGGGGGLVEYRSALLASRGYVALALEYIGRVDAAGKPYQVNNEYFEVFASKPITFASVFMHV